MDDAGLNYAEDYPRLVEEAHRRAPRALGPPALAWHVGLREEDRAADGAGGASSRAESLHHGVQRLIDAIYSQAGIPTAQRFHILEPADGAPVRTDVPRARTIPMEFAFGGALLKVTFDRHHEFTTITFLLDFSKPPSKHVRNYEIGDPRAVQCVRRAGDALRSLRTQLERLQRETKREDRKTADHAEIRAAQAYLYQGFWAEVRDLIDLAPPILGTAKKGPVFVDMRGLVLSAGDEDRLNSWQNVEKFREVTTFNDAINASTISRYDPFIQDAHPGADDKEFVFCNMLRKRALFISAIGDPGPYIAREDMRPRTGRVAEPLKYLVLVNGYEAARTAGGGRKPYERWQLGRMVSRLHNLCTHRLMGLRDFQSIDLKGEEARKLDSRVDQLAVDVVNNATPANRLKLIQLFVDLSKLNDMAHGGLSYRINRSRTFFTVYQRMIPDLNIDPIDGFMPYDVFMRRQLYGVFDYIDRIGILIEKLTTRANTLFAFVDAQDQSRTLTSILGLQRTADIFIPFAFAYYVTKGMGLDDLGLNIQSILPILKSQHLTFLNAPLKGIIVYLSGLLLWVPIRAALSLGVHTYSQAKAAVIRAVLRPRRGGDEPHR